MQPETTETKTVLQEETIFDVGDPSSDEEQYIPRNHEETNVVEEEIIDEINTEDYQPQQENQVTAEPAFAFLNPS